MAQPATNPKIEELRFRLKTDPKSRLFYQLAEELRRAGQPAEAEQVLRSGLAVYPTYLAAWVSLGRALRELKNEGGAIEALNRAMQLDPGNVVAARLLADAHLALGDKTEAIKKYKLAHALMPGDEDLKATIETLDRELHPPEPAPEAVAAPVAAPEPEPEPAYEPEPEPEPEPEAKPEPEPEAEPEPEPEPEPEAEPEPVAEEQPAFAAAPEESPFDKTVPPFDESTGDAEPMLAAHEESPFEEPADAALVASFEVEQPAGFHVDEAPVSAEVAAPVVTAADDADTEAEAAVFEEAPAAPAPVEEVTETSTMADLYARQGLHNEARHIYEHILARDPGNVEVRAKLDAITPRVNPKIDRLERWLAKVSRKEVGSV